VKLGGRIVSLGLALAWLAGAGSAQAGTIQVTATQTDYTIVFNGSPGEANTVTLGVVGQLGDPATYSITDATAPLTAGPGCTGGGTAGSTATCQVPASSSSCVGHPCSPSPTISIAFEVDLGDSADVLDSTAIPARDAGTGSFALSSSGGPGADRITDGPQSASFAPGPGADTVKAGDGYDTIIASDGTVDEGDVYDGGAGEDTVTYAAATYPVTASLDDAANDGGTGEGDQILGTEILTGGASADELVGSDVLPYDFLHGLGGDDTLVGGPGNDEIEGGSGGDSISGLDGDDRVYADDILGPGDGDDRVSGGPGNDFIVGDGGRDRLRGGLGADQLTGATTTTRDHVADRLDCGPGRDPTALVGPEDRVRHCERTKPSGLPL
jgi:Ca2+-binding RTX toxin-like protein